MKFLLSMLCLFSMFGVFAQTKDAKDLEYRVVKKTQLNREMPVAQCVVAGTIQEMPVIENRVYTVVEKMPEFPGGERALMNFIVRTIKYPEGQEDIQGRVVVCFVVDEDGTVSDVVVKKTLNPLFDQEALRVVRALPKFIPGRQRGVPVRVSYVLPIQFTSSGK